MTLLVACKLERWILLCGWLMKLLFFGRKGASFSLVVQIDP
jgi:hypothetical protein